MHLLCACIGSLGLLQLACAASLEGVRNFRRVSASLPGIYRSAGLEGASLADAAELLDGARIRTIIDLRNADEIEKAARRSTAAGRALLAAYQRGEKVGSGCLASEGSGYLAWHNVPLLADVDGFFEAVEAQLNPVRKAEALVLKAVNGRRYNQFLYDEVARGKQLLLNTCILKSASREAWGRALSLAADRSSGGVLIHCAQGKDRTGVLAALLQHAAGDSEAEIINAYAESEALLAIQSVPAGDEPQSEASTGVDWSALRGSPPEAMRDTLKWLKREHGAIDRFLRHVGCGEEWRDQLLASSMEDI